MASIPRTAVLVPHVDAAARRMAGTGGSSSSCQPRGSAGSASGAGCAVFWLCEDRAVVARALEPARKPEQMSRMRPGGALVNRSRSLGVRGPPSGSRRSRRSAWIRPGRRAAGAAACRPLDFVGQLLRDGRAQVAAGPASRRGGCRPAMCRLGPMRRMSRSRPGDRVEVGTVRGPRARRPAGVSRSRARPLRWRSVPRPSGQNIIMVDVRRTEPGRRTGGATAGSEGGGVSGETTGPPFRKSCFHATWCRTEAAPFGPLY